MIIDKLIDAIIKTKNPSVVGIDTAFSYLPDDMKEGVNNNKVAAEKIIEFNKAIIDAICDIVPAIKVQVAYYEAYGVQGMEAFKQTLLYGKEKGMITISDVKRNDIGATSKAYSSAFLGVNDLGIKAEFDSDYVTLNGYLGTDGIKPFVEDCKTYDRGAFILVRTSNPSSYETQNVPTAGESIYQLMGDLVARWGNDLVGKYNYSSIGAVVGATQKSEAEDLRKRLPSVFFLVPGYGAQGGTADDLAVCFDDKGLGAIVNSSRGILCAYKNKNLNYAEAAREAAIEMRDDIVSAMKRNGKTAWLD